MSVVKNLLCLIILLSIRLLGQELGDLTIYNTDNSELTYNQINCIEFGGENSVWIGTENGLNIFNDSNDSWINYENNSGWCALLDNPITSLEWKDTYLGFIGTNNGILDVIASENNIDGCEEYGVSCPPANGVINTLLYDESYQLWAGSTDGLCVEGLGTKDSWLVQNTSTGFYSNNITTIKQNPNNNMIAIGTMNGGLVTYDGEFNTYYSSNSDVLDNTILDLAFDQNNNIIICTPQAGLGVLTENGSWIWFNTVNSELTSNSLTNVIVDNNNNLWITTLENGLIYYKENTFYNYTTENSNLPDNKITCLSFDADNHLWLGTENSGVVKIDNPSISINEDFDARYTYIYPTMLKSDFNIDVPKTSVIEIFNRTGQLINYYKLNTGLHNIDIHNYNSGLYLVVVKNIDSKEIFKLIKY